jgi:transposase
MAQQGEWTLAEIAKALGKDRTTIVRWLKAYRQDGLQELLARGHGGRQPRLKTDDIQALKAELRKGNWKTAKQIRDWLKERGIGMTVWGVYYWLKKVKAKSKVPRKTHKDQNPKQIESAITDVLKPFWEKEEGVFGLLGDNWLTRGVFTFMNQRKAVETSV